jgi:hypothetical protein
MANCNSPEYVDQWTPGASSWYSAVTPSGPRFSSYRKFNQGLAMMTRTKENPRAELEFLGDMAVRRLLRD